MLSVGHRPEMGLRQQGNPKDWNDGRGHSKSAMRIRKVANLDLELNRKLQLTLLRQDLAGGKDTGTKPLSFQSGQERQL